MFARLFAHPGNQGRAGLARPATEDDRLRIEQRGDGDDRSREVLDHRLRGAREASFRARPRERLCCAQLLSGDAADALSDRLLSHDCGEVLAPLSAKEGQLTRLAAGEVGPSVETAIKKHPRADAGAQREKHEALQAGGGAAPLLAEGAAVRVALDEHRNAVTSFE